MPIYEYKCSACGFQEEYLQKVSEPQLTKCPSCGRKKFEKLVSAAGFQLKGSGWYATDFKGGGTNKPAEPRTEAQAQSKTESKAETKTEAKTESKTTESKTEKKPEKKAEDKAETKSATTPASTAN